MAREVWIEGIEEMADPLSESVNEMPASVEPLESRTEPEMLPDVCAVASLRLTSRSAESMQKPKVNLLGKVTGPPAFRASYEHPCYPGVE